MSSEVITKTEIETGTGTEAKIKIKKTNKAITTTATTTTTSATSTLQQNHESDRINKSKFEAATSGLLNCYVNPLKELALKSNENAATIVDYILAMSEETNPSNMHKKNQIITLTQLSEYCCSSKNNNDNDNDKTFLQMTRDDVLTYLGKCRKPEDIDPMHKWIGTYNLRRGYLLRFFKWLYNPNLEPNKRPIPQNVIGNIPSFKRKEKSIYKPTDLWTEEDDSLFLKYCPSKRDRCYHMMSRDLSARPHEILGLKNKGCRLQDKWDTAICRSLG